MAGGKSQPYGFSKSAVDSAVFKKTITHPASVYPTAIGALGGLGILLFKAPIAFAVSAAGFVFGIGSFLVNHYFRRDTFARFYLDAVHKNMQEKTAEALATLGDELKELNSEQGQLQLPKLQAKFENFSNILERKLEKQEITYGRYKAVAEQVYLAAVDNLHEVTTKLRSVSTIDERYIKSRLKELSRDKDPKAREEENSLKERWRLFQKTRKETLDLISDNEEAMTQLDKTATALADIQTKSGKAVMDMEYAMEELTELANRTYMYDRRKRGKYGRITASNKG